MIKELPSLRAISKNFSFAVSFFVCRIFAFFKSITGIFYNHFFHTLSSLSFISSLRVSLRLMLAIQVRVHLPQPVQKNRENLSTGYLNLR